MHAARITVFHRAGVAENAAELQFVDFEAERGRSNVSSHQVTAFSKSVDGGDNNKRENLGRQPADQWHCNSLHHLGANG
jgi:hypothetical protein